MTFRSPKLLKSSRDQACVRCGNTTGVVSAHYTGVRRLQLGGGYGIKVHDFMTADLCSGCHEYMDTLSREKEKRYGHSEEFFYYIALTMERRFLQGTLVVARGAVGVADLSGQATSEAIHSGAPGVGDTSGAEPCAAQGDRA